jgi:hypothetical protein
MIEKTLLNTKHCLIELNTKEIGFEFVISHGLIIKLLILDIYITM